MSTEPVAWVWFENGRGFVAYVWRRFVGDRCLGTAATLSYTSLLALVPIAAIGFAIIAAVPVFEDSREGINSFVFDNFVPDTGEQITEHFDDFVDNAERLTTIGIAGLVVAAIMLLATIGSTFNTIFRVSRPRRLTSRLLAYFVVIVVGPIALAAIVSLAANISEMTAWLGLDGILFAALRWAFGLYLDYFPIYQTIYGALSASPIFLVWMYLCWAAFLIGAVVTASLPEWRGARPLNRG